MKHEAEQRNLFSVIREVESSLIKCDCISLERLAERCGTLIDENLRYENYIGDPEGEFDGEDLQPWLREEAGERQVLGRLLESTRGTLKILGQSGLIGSVQNEYCPDSRQGE
jgi:hypothetical protein